MPEPTPIDALLERAERFVHDTLIPLEPAFLAGGDEAIRSDLDAARDQARDLGLWAPQLPVEDGGQAMPLRDFARLSETLGQTPFGHYACNVQAPDIGNMELLHSHASEAQRETFYRPLTRGAIRSCFAMTEPEHAGSNPVWMSTRAVRDGDSWVIDGHKWFTSSADGAAFAVTMAVTDPDAAPHARASMLLVPTDAPGFVHVRNIPVMGERGGGYFSHAEVRFENCRVPADSLLGEQGAGFAMAQERLGPGRVHHAMRWIGICRRALDLLCQRAAARQLDPDRVLGDQQVIQHWIAECATNIHAARLMVLDCAEALETQGGRAARQQVSMIKVFVADVLMRTLDRAIQVHGALGVTDDIILAWWYRHERAARIYDGPDEVHKNVIARRLLKAHGLQPGR
ncbi:MAG: acyl-CoA dehydrogenase family protein [Acidobacteriota bacterium]